MIRSIYDVELLRSACEGSPWDAGHEPLLGRLQAAAPDLGFRLACERGGWYRAGGVIRRDGRRLARNLRAWAESQLDEVGPCMTLPEDWDDLLATRIKGSTVYLVAVVGDRAWDFAQLELEVVQEVTDRELFPSDFVPEDIEDFLDPPATVARLAPTALGQAEYRFHGISHIAQLREELDLSLSTNRRFLRFLEDWEHSSAGGAVRFCDHWVLRLFRYDDRFGEDKVEATPVPQRAAPPLPAAAHAAGGSELTKILWEFDRAVGYPMAWFFHILTAQKNMYGIAEQVVKDHGRGVAYLADKDLEALRAWYNEPYCF